MPKQKETIEDLKENIEICKRNDNRAKELKCNDDVRLFRRKYQSGIPGGIEAMD